MRLKTGFRRSSLKNQLTAVVEHEQKSEESEKNSFYEDDSLEAESFVSKVKGLDSDSSDCEDCFDVPTGMLPK